MFPRKIKLAQSFFSKKNYYYYIYMMNKIRTKEEEEFRKKRKERTIKSLSRAAKVKHRRRGEQSAKKASLYTSSHLSNRREEWRDKRNCRGEQKKEIVIVQILYTPIETVIIRTILFIIRFPILLSPSLPPSPLVPRFGKLSTSNERIYRFSRSILVYLFYVSRVVTRRPPPLCEISG